MIDIDKTWAAIEGGDEIAFEAPTENELYSHLREQGEDPSDYEIVALPDAHRWMWLI